MKISIYLKTVAVITFYFQGKNATVLIKSIISKSLFEFIPSCTT